MKLSRLAAALAAATFTLTLTGCGGEKSDLSELSATEILKKTKAAAAAAGSVSISGSGEDDGTTIAVDLAFSGDEGSGTIEVGGMEITVLGVDGDSYFKAGPEFYASLDPSAASVIGDKWIIVDPADSNFADLASFSSRDDFFESLLDPDGTVTKGEKKEIDGVDTIGLVTKSGTLFVAVEDGRPISLEKGEGGDTLSFDYDDVEAPKAPSADEIFDLSQVSG